VTAAMMRSFDLGGFDFADDGRTVVGRAVPFDEVADVVEKVDGEVRRYREAFRHGSFTRMEQKTAKRGNCSWVKLNLDHDDRLSHYIGHGQRVEQRADGVWLTFRLFDGPDLPKVQDMLQTSHRGLSVEFWDVVPPVNVDGVVVRTQVHLSGCAATPVPIYAGAGIAEVRAHDVDLGSFDLASPALDEVRSWLETLK